MASPSWTMSRCSILIWWLTINILPLSSRSWKWFYSIFSRFSPARSPRSWSYGTSRSNTPSWATSTSVWRSRVDVWNYICRFCSSRWIVSSSSSRRRTRSSESMLAHYRILSPANTLVPTRNVWLRSSTKRSISYNSVISCRPSFSTFWPIDASEKNSTNYWRKTSSSRVALLRLRIYHRQTHRVLVGIIIIIGIIIPGRMSTTTRMSSLNTHV